MDEKKPPAYERPELPFERKATPLAQAGRWSAVGLEFGLAVGLFLLGGSKLDEKLGTSPWLAVTGALVGIAVGMYLMLRPLLRGGSGASPSDPSGDSPSPPRD